MIRTGRYDEERLGELLGLLRPAPEGWVLAAQELPTARQRLDERLDEIIALAEADALFREALLADLESAVIAAGYEPAPPLVEALRKRFAAQ